MQGIVFSIPMIREDPDLKALIRELVPGDEPSPMIGRREKLEEHCESLKLEFAGQPQLYFFHAVLNVHIRRNVEADWAWFQFCRVWTEMQRDLLRGLTSRWLVSACDTIMERSDSPYEQAMACAGSTLLNTLKLFETERAACSQTKPLPAEPRPPTPIFDGMTTFALGSGDMIHALRKRTEKVCGAVPGSIAAAIMREALVRADRHDTVYGRLARVHRNESTRWWDVANLPQE